MDPNETKSNETDRRAFLQKCGRFAIVTPPAISMLLSTSLTSDAIAKSGGGRARHKGRHKGHSHSHKKNHGKSRNSQTTQIVNPGPKLHPRG